MTKELVRVTFEFADGTAFYYEGPAAEQWSLRVNTAIKKVAHRSGSPDPCRMGELRSYQKCGTPWQYEREEMVQEIDRAKS